MYAARFGPAKWPPREAGTSKNLQLLAVSPVVSSVLRADHLAPLAVTKKSVPDSREC